MEKTDDSMLRVSVRIDSGRRHLYFSRCSPSHSDRDSENMLCYYTFFPQNLKRSIFTIQLPIGTIFVRYMGTHNKIARYPQIDTVLGCALNTITAIHNYTYMRTRNISYYYYRTADEVLL